MRLTLRTLLAYLDDVLEPNEAREIGEKINQSKEASALVTQIREAIRRRRIGAPELAGPGSGPDPNVVSEYLENVLSPNQVVEYEKLCRSSELHLAEIAACHKILTMVLGQPIDVSDELRERIYELGANKEATTSPNVPDPKPAPQMTSGMGSTTTNSFGEGLPDYLKKGKQKGRIWSTLIVIIIAGVWVALIVSDESIWDKTPNNVVAQNTDSDQRSPEIDADNIEENNTVKNSSKSNEIIPKAGSQASATAQSNKQPLTNKAGVSINPPPPADNVVAANSIPEPQLTTTTLIPETPAEMEANVPESVVEEPVEVAIVDKAQPQGKNNQQPQLNQGEQFALMIQQPDGINILHSEETGKWVTTEGGDIAIGDSFAVPTPFQGRLNFRGDLNLRLLSETRIKRLAPAEGIDIALEIERGQVLIQRPATSIHARVISVSVGEHSWTFNFAETGTELAIGVILQQPDGRIFDDEPIPRKGGVAVTSGRLKLLISDEENLDLKRSSGWLSWVPKTGELLIDEPMAIPIWTNPDEVLITPARSQLSKAFEREFQADVLQSIAPVISDRRAIISEFAVKTLALTDNYLEIVPALKSDHEEARLASIVSLREWLAGDPSRIDQLREEMDRLFRPELVEQIVNLLWGYRRSDAQSPETSQLLVKLLGNEDLAIRELAHFQVTRLSGRNYGYHSQAPVAERNAAINRWVEFVKRDKSLVKPE